MTDFLSKKDRSDLMSRIRSKNTKPEVLLRKYLFSKGCRYRLHVKELPGSPDIVLPKYRTVISIRGCFWHKHGCRRSNMPKSNVQYWSNKLKTNAERDKRNDKLIKKLGWKNIIVWECQIASKKGFEKIKRRTFMKLI